MGRPNIQNNAIQDASGLNYQTLSTKLFSIIAIFVFINGNIYFELRSASVPTCHKYSILHKLSQSTYNFKTQYLLTKAFASILPKKKFVVLNLRPQSDHLTLKHPESPQNPVRLHHSSSDTLYRSIRFSFTPNSC